MSGDRTSKQGLAMAPLINGLHHVTAISGSARRNAGFYTGTLGLRLVKRTVNFDDPSVYHLYYGDRVGTPGSVLTFFPWEQMGPGRRGVGETSLTHYAVPPGSLDFWRRRLEAAGVGAIGSETRFGEERLTFLDPDGMALALVAAGDDEREPWTTPEVGAEVALRGFHGVSLSLAEAGPTAEVLSTLLGYEERAREGDTLRLIAPAAAHARTVDLVARSGAPRAMLGAGSVHHIAFAVADRAEQAAVRARIAAAGLGVTPSIDRNYFFSIYFREPGGVLFEVATEEPGFAVDEPVDELGASLRLPPQHEHLRPQLLRTLPPLGM
jgi:glyoxalase family protein